MKDKINEVKFHKNLIPVLKELSVNHRLFILSSNKQEIIELELNKNNLNIFEAVYSSSSLFKKDKSIKKLLKLFKLEIENVFYVGDEVRDIEACKAINVKIISVTWGFNSKQILSLYNPEYLIDTPVELLEIMKD